LERQVQELARSNVSEIKWISGNITAQGQREIAAALAARGETWEGFINRKLGENLAREKFSSVKKSNE
jgi:hypothetical protein